MRIKRRFGVIYDIFFDPQELKISFSFPDDYQRKGKKEVYIDIVRPLGDYLPENFTGGLYFASENNVYININVSKRFYLINFDLKDKKFLYEQY